tara:strand:+ start:418 stop:558 length:141 start_codon:yes stop_codon:yes gene_type:complete
MLRVTRKLITKVAINGLMSLNIPFSGKTKSSRKNIDKIGAKLFEPG